VSEGALLAAENLTREFDGVEVLSDVSVTVDPGTVTAVIGPNGSGKTTLLGLLCGLLQPTAGSVEYLGPPVSREIGYVPQRPSFRPGFTARETLEFYAALVDDETPAERLDRVGLAAVAGRQVEALSGGMVRLLGVAQATVGDPPVVVLDEPGTGLDPGMSRRIFEVIGELAAGGGAVVLSSHDLPRVERFADRALVLDRGELVAEGSPPGLCEQYGVDSLTDVFDALAPDSGDAVRTVDRRGRTEHREGVSE